MLRKLVGRKDEIKALKSALQSNRPELVAVYGRRRVGKTYLITKTLKNHIKFEVTGTYNISMKDQLKNFHLQLKSKLDDETPADWLEAFDLLKKFMNKVKSTQKKVIFIDEFPWFDSRRSRFLQSFENFWNSYGSRQDDLMVVISGSAASYMIQEIVRSKGGLHNRITQKIPLKPLNLYETELLLKSMNIQFVRYDILKIYMAMGGIPFYLERINPGESVGQALNRLCFKKAGFLNTEFENIFASLFEQHKNHESIVIALSIVRKGLTRTELSKKSGVDTGGTLTKTLDELIESGFIENYTPYQGKKDSLFRLSDEYSLFYLKYIKKAKSVGQNYWERMEGTQSYKTWAGFTFETICIKHVDQIRNALGILGVNAESASWLEKSLSGGAQIDLLIDRDDNIINICEMKFYNSEFTINKKYTDELNNKVNVFKNSTKTKKNVWITFVTTFGLNHNQYSRQIVNNELKMDDLFVDL